MYHRALAGHGGAAGRAAAPVPRVESDVRPGRSSSSLNSHRDRDRMSYSSASSASTKVSRQADRSRDDAKTSRGGASMAPGLSLDATIRRVQESWDATRASEIKSSPGNVAPRDVHAEAQRMKGLNRTSAASSHLGKRSSSGAYEDVLERKRRAVEDGRGASGRQGASTPVSNGGSEEASRRRSAPTAGMVNGASSNKPQDAPQVLRAVRSATNKPLSPALRGAEAKTARPQLLEKTASGRLYKVFIDHEGKTIPSAGALIPDGYELYDDDTSPFICPVRSCRKLYRNVTALGAHFGAGHRHVNLNDNGDGTLSVVGQFNAVSGPITARVVSRKPLDPSEPPMPIPKPPGLVRPITTPRNGSPPPGVEKTATAASRRSPRAPPQAVDSPDSSSPASWSPSPVSSSPAPTPDLGTKVMPYIRAVLPPSFDFGLFTVCKEGPLLLQLPVKRHITAKWIERTTSLKTRSQRCLVAMLLFLTGTSAENPCPSCVTSDSGDECIIPSASFPPFVIEKFEGSCAACFYRCNRWHQRNNCLLRKARGPTRAEREAGFEFLMVGLEEDDMPSDDEAVDSGTPPPEMSESAKGAVENEALAFADLLNGASKNRALQARRPGPASGMSQRGTSERNISERHTQMEPSPPQPPTPEPHVTSPARESQGASAHDALSNQGNLMPADALEMEDWEIAPGTIRNASDEPDNIAFSNAYLFSNMAVPVAPGIAFNVITLKPGGGHKFPAQQSLRLCSLATGKLSVKMEQEGSDVGFQIGPNGMFKVYPGTVASVRNRLYVDAVLHVSTVESPDA